MSKAQIASEVASRNTDASIISASVDLSVVMQTDTPMLAVTPILLQEERATRLVPAVLLMGSPTADAAVKRERLLIAVATWPRELIITALRTYALRK